MRSTILIAPQYAIPALRQQPSLHDAVAFADTDMDRALARIRQERPQCLAIEREFAASLSGQAIIHQVTSDPHLAGCEIQTVGLRRATRHKVVDRVVLDGSPATLLDISTTGAAVVCAATVKPKQEVQIALRHGTQPLTALAVWVRFEIPAEGPRYRAGLEFVPSAAATVARYISDLMP